jgi:hypothetical protein
MGDKAEADCRVGGGGFGREPAAPDLARAHLFDGRPMPGPHTPPDGPDRLVARLSWLPVFAAVLALITIARVRGSQPRRHPAGRRTELDHAGTRPATRSTCARRTVSAR